MAEITLNANERQKSNKGANKQLRRQGSVPGVFYSKGQEPVLIEVPELALKPLIYTSEAHIVSLKVGDKEGLTCVLKDVQFDPVTDRVVHFDLHGINTSDKMEIEVPILLVGNAAGIKQGGVLQQVLHKLDVECLPKDMPEHLTVNVEKLNLGDSIHVRDLSFENIDVLNAPDAVVVSVVTPRAEKEATEEAAAEPEVIAKGKTDKEEE
ncbi:MAG: 50S ribosomal protein L25 [Bacteroidota bacterium]|jgi:large subunit ribosomal protein L25|nr:50S ribosomal protein L25 [Ignavibacteria bacterium]MCU7498936.1 50S ribosomal protein L25 [Ignavibacteria bacterium]MCU7513326.1 50S ribosomal protein L25 [Ignavibacteria bacterium]MCU7521382.1 50S ribosomal protein L25 [Ignavibacteria bacterium]MCU7524171.1 50S ribosomal protein L25 [Ignavibacteria bacterium]